MLRYKKGMVAIVITFFIVSFVAPFVDSWNISNASGEVNIKLTGKKWTWMFYNDADFTPGYDPMNDFAKEAYSAENLNVIVLHDNYGNPAKIWYIDEHHNKRLLEEWGEVDMGDYQTLRDFIEYSKENYPAERYLLSFYDHGMGWRGACIDDTNHDWLTMNEIQKALRETGGVDIVCFTAPCNMGALESVYELRDCTDVYIGSEAGSGYVWWQYIISDICDMLNQNPDADDIALGKQIINLIEKDHYRWSFVERITMSAIRTDKMKELANSIDIVAGDFIANFEESYEKIQSVYDDVQSFGAGRYLDVYDFTQKYLNVETNQTTRQHLESVMNCLSDAVIAECHGNQHPNAHGLTIYFPNPAQYRYDSSYSSVGYGLDFSRDTQWNEFLEYYFGRKPYVIVYGINGGLGVTAYLKNIGGRYGSDVSWEIIIDAPLMLSGRISKGSVDIEPGEVIQIKSDIVMGIGPATISVITENDKETVHGFVIGPFVSFG